MLITVLPNPSWQLSLAQLSPSLFGLFPLFVIIFNLEASITLLRSQQPPARNILPNLYTLQANDLIKRATHKNESGEG